MQSHVTLTTRGGTHLSGDEAKDLLQHFVDVNNTSANCVNNNNRSEDVCRGITVLARWRHGQDVEHSHYYSCRIEGENANGTYRVHYFDGYVQHDVKRDEIITERQLRILLDERNGIPLVALQKVDSKLVLQGCLISVRGKRRDKVGYTTGLRTSRRREKFLKKSSRLFIMKYISDKFAAITHNEREQKKLKVFISILQRLIDMNGGATICTDMVENNLLLIYNDIFQFISDANGTILSHLTETQDPNRNKYLKRFANNIRKLNFPSSNIDKFNTFRHFLRSSLNNLCTVTTTTTTTTTENDNNNDLQVSFVDISLDETARESTETGEDGECNNNVEGTHINPNPKDIAENENAIREKEKELKEMEKTINTAMQKNNEDANTNKQAKKSIEKMTAEIAIEEEQLRNKKLIQQVRKARLEEMQLLQKEKEKWLRELRFKKHPNLKSELQKLKIKVAQQKKEEEYRKLKLAELNALDVKRKKRRREEDRELERQREKEDRELEKERKKYCNLNQKRSCTDLNTFRST